MQNFPENFLRKKEEFQASVKELWKKLETRLKLRSHEADEDDEGNVSNASLK